MPTVCRGRASYANSRPLKSSSGGSAALGLSIHILHCIAYPRGGCGGWCISVLRNVALSFLLQALFALPFTSPCHIISPSIPPPSPSAPFGQIRTLVVLRHQDSPIFPGVKTSALLAISETPRRFPRAKWNSALLTDGQGRRHPLRHSLVEARSSGVLRR